MIVSPGWFQETLTLTYSLPSLVGLRPEVLL
jgi:hypothetical protein